MEKTKEEMLNYAVNMRLRGDNYRAILNYLERHTSDQNLINEIINSVDLLEKNNEIKPLIEKKNKLSFINVVLSSVLILLGLYLVFSLWGEGYIATLPFLIIGLGIWTLSGKMK